MALSSSYWLVRLLLLVRLTLTPLTLTLTLTPRDGRTHIASFTVTSQDSQAVDALRNMWLQDHTPANDQYFPAGQGVGVISTEVCIVIA